MSGRQSYERYGQQQRMFREHSGSSSSVLPSARSVGYPSPPSTYSSARSTSASPSPLFSAHDRGLFNLPISSCLASSLTASSSPSSMSSSSSSYHPTVTIADWSLPMSPCGGIFHGNARVGLYSGAPSSLSMSSQDSMIAFNPLPVSSSLPVTSTGLDFNFGQQHAPLLVNGNINCGGSQPLKDEDTESWFSDVDFGHFESDMEFSNQRGSGAVYSPSLSSSHKSREIISPPPGLGFDSFATPSLMLKRQLTAPPRYQKADLEALEPVQPDAKVRRQSEAPDRKYTCPVCQRMFDKRYNLVQHEKKHDANRVSQFSCPHVGCGKRLGRKTDVDRHIQSVHVKAKRFACAKCSKRFDRKDTLAR